MLSYDIQWNNKLIVDFSNISFITPVIAVCYKVFKLLGNETILPCNSSAKEYLNWMTNSDISYGGSRYIPIYSVKADTEVLHLIKKLLNIFSEWLNEESKDFLSYSLGELMENVFAHADSNLGLVIHVQKYDTRYNQNIEVCIADIGKGIADSMAENSKFSHLKSKDRFYLALQSKKTSKPDRHSGEGLSSIIEWIKNNQKAEAIIISKNNVWYKKNNEVNMIDFSHIKWNGTLIWLSFPKLSSISLLKIWEKMELNPE